MKLFLLKRIGRVGWDENEACIIRAISHNSARQIAFGKLKGEEPNKVWLDPKKSYCKEIKQTDKPGIILIDFKAG
ncbi:MAG: hypothetical protein V3U02_00355 [Calditrichia bacterium]